LLLMPLWVLAYVWPGALTAVIAGAVAGYAGLMFFSVAWETAIQDQVPHHLLARVASWDSLASFMAMPIGNVLAGPLVLWWGTDPVLLGCALVLAAASVIPLIVRGSRHLTRPAATRPRPAVVGPAPCRAPPPRRAGGRGRGWGGSRRGAAGPASCPAGSECG